MALYDVSTSEKKDNPLLVGGGTLYADSPIGIILPYGGASAPSGWFLCQGQALSRTTYSELFAVIGTSFGIGDGSTTFNLPDMRESVPKGAGLTGHTVGAHLDADGLAVGEFLDDQLQAHTHSNKTGTSTAGQDAWTMFATNQVGTATEQTNNGVVGRFGATTETKSVGVNYIIKAKMVGVPADFLAKVDEAVVEANEYSTTETVVGKWIDGKPIYRKVCVVPSNFSTSGQTWVSTGINKPSNIDKLIGVSLVFRPDGKSYNLDFDCTGSTTIMVSTLFTSSLNVIVNSHFTIEYTKTTD